MGDLVAPIFGNGYDGDVTYASTSYGIYNAAFTGTAGSTTGSGTSTEFPSFITYPIIIHQTRGVNAGQWERNFMIGYSPGTITFSIPLANTYTDGAQILIMRQRRTTTIPLGVTMSFADYDGVKGGVLGFCTERLVIAGTLDGVGGGFRGGPGGVNTNSGGSGESTLGYGPGGTSAYNTGGGGGDNLGGNGSGATTTVGNTDLSIINIGGGGGGANVPSGQSAVNGGAGGAVIIIWARELDISGTINVNGQAGQSGYRASGAGAGGSVLIFAQKIINLHASAITALGGTSASSSNGGGTGGGGSNATAGTSGTNSGGGAGGNGRIAIAKCSVDYTNSNASNPVYYDRGYQTYCGFVGRD